MEQKQMHEEKQGREPETSKPDVGDCKAGDGQGEACWTANEHGEAHWTEGLEGRADDHQRWDQKLPRLISSKPGPGRLLKAVEEWKWKS